MIGAEVENQEQTVRGTIHWEKRLFGVGSSVYTMADSYSDVHLIE